MRTSCQDRRLTMRRSGSITRPVTLQPLLTAPFIIQTHALAAITAFVIGLVQLTAPKGTIPHRLIGWSGVMLMLTVAVSSLFIHKIRMWGPWSPIHLLSIPVLVTLPLAVMHARRHDIAQHRIAMLRCSRAPW